tara:strand:+ start:576 stop:848 length:273 start_codon:yes stop_codon:yes gene_type:complete
MENNTDVLLYLAEINTNLQVVVEELKKLNKNKNTPNLFDIFGGMNKQGVADDEDEDEDEDDDEDDDEDNEDEVEEEVEEKVEKEVEDKKD